MTTLYVSFNKLADFLSWCAMESISDQIHAGVIDNSDDDKFLFTAIGTALRVFDSTQYLAVYFEIAFIENKPERENGFDSSTRKLNAQFRAALKRADASIAETNARWLKELKQVDPNHRYLPGVITTTQPAILNCIR